MERSIAYAGSGPPQLRSPGCVPPVLNHAPLLLLLSLLFPSPARGNEDRAAPNFVIILADDK
jgi:hypothetical protein